MAKKRTSGEGKAASGGDARMQLFERFLQQRGKTYLQDRNITSIGIGYKIKGGKETETLSFQVTVAKKGDTQIEVLGSERIPDSIEFEGVKIPTDVIQRKYKPGYRLVATEAPPKNARKKRLQTLVPGISVGHPGTTAGTLGAIVYDAKTGAACMLSNWHVLHTGEGDIGDTVLQPGPYDDNTPEGNETGVLLRSHLGLAGDCAIARIEGRGFKPEIMGLNTAAGRLAKPALRDAVVKSGRTTDVTYGLVRRVRVTAKIDYEGKGTVEIGGFEIGPDRKRPAKDGEISMGGDSGSVWMIADKGKATDIMVGLHFAGEGEGNTDEHALACYAHSVFEKLEIALAPKLIVKDPGIDGKGYSPQFLGVKVQPPAAGKKNIFLLDGSPLIPYTHFSVCLNTERRMAQYVAWNIDGGSIKQLSRKEISFVLDPRVPDKFQAGDELYSKNDLDRGHIARRADLIWGALPEAKSANKDSFFFTNITPQHASYNQSSRGGLWGRLENTVFEQVEVQDLKASVFGGPIFRTNDLKYRSFLIPSEFWKIILYRDAEEDGALKAAGFILSQKKLLRDVEALQFDEFRTYRTAVSEIGRLTGLTFDEATTKADIFRPGAIQRVEALAESQIQEVTSEEGLFW